MSPGEVSACARHAPSMKQVPAAIVVRSQRSALSLQLCVVQPCPSSQEKSPSSQGLDRLDQLVRLDDGVHCWQSLAGSRVPDA